MAMYGYEVFRHQPEYFNGNQMQEMHIVVRYIGEDYPNSRYPFYHGDRFMVLRFMAFSNFDNPKWGTLSYDIEGSKDIRLLKRAVVLAERIEENTEYVPEMTEMQQLQSALRASNIVPIKRVDNGGALEYVEADELPSLALREWR